LCYLYFEQTVDYLQTSTVRAYQYGLKNITGADYLIAQEKIQRFTRKIAQWYSEEEYDLLLFLISW